MIRAIALSPLATLAMAFMLGCLGSTPGRPVVMAAEEPRAILVNPAVDPDPDNQPAQITEQGDAMQQAAQAKVAKRAAEQREAIQQGRANELNSSVDYARMQTVEWRVCYAAAFFSDAKARYEHERTNPSGIVNLRVLHDLAEDVRNGQDMVAETTADFARERGRAFGPSDCDGVYP